jgi:hypothetical protein
MNIRDDDQVSAVALVVESDAPTAASVVDDGAPVDLTDSGAPDVPMADDAEPDDE